MQIEFFTIKFDTSSDIPFIANVFNVTDRLDMDRSLFYIQRDMYGTWMLEIGFIRVL